MSPESIQEPTGLDGRSDLYALGAVGYFLLTGDHVFEGKTLVEVCGHHLHTAPVSPSERLDKPVPPDLEAVLLDCLAKDPSKRPENAAVLRERLRSCQAYGEWDGDEARRWWRERSTTLSEWRTRRVGPNGVDSSTKGPPPGSLLSVDVQARGIQ
jgi:serine/threonine protein kinase